METKAEYLERLRRFQSDQERHLDQVDLLGKIIKQPNRSKDDLWSLELGSRALGYLFSHDIEAVFLKEHVQPETKQPTAGTNIEQVKAFWLPYRKKGVLPIYPQKNLKEHFDLDVHCRTLEQIMAEYDPASSEHQVLELTARALIYLDIHGYGHDLLTYSEELDLDPPKAYEADFRRLFFKNMGKHLPP